MSRYDHLSKSAFLEQVNLGLVAGHSMTASVGVSDHVGTSYVDISGMLSDLVYPTANETWLLTSDSADDDSAGIGCTEVTVIYLDDDYVQQISVVATDGTSDVIVGTDCFRIVAVLCTNYGTLRGENKGDITIRNQSGGAERERIQATELDSHSIHHTVPAGFTDYWLSSVIFPPKNDDVSIKVFYGIGEGSLFRGGASTVSYQSPLIYPFNAWLKLPEKSEFVQKAKASNPNSQVTVVSEFLRVNNANGIGI